MPFLEITDVSTHYVSSGGRRVVRAVDGVSLVLERGQTLGIVGESGSGKSTLALSILRLLPPAARAAGGRILFDGEDLLAKSAAAMRAIRGNRIAMILQDPMASLDPLFTVGSQVVEPLREHRGMRRAAAWAKGRELLQAVRIPAAADRMRSYPHELSGGMRQRIVGAIALACEPDLLIADEPTTSLDLTVQAQILDLLADIRRERGLALVFITHNLGIVARMCERVAVMYAGRIVEAAPVRHVFDHPAHPYTRALVAALPRPGKRRARLATIDGQPPDPGALPAGCAFHPRCPDAGPRCRREAPPDFAPLPEVTVRCWLHSPGGVGAGSGP